MVEWFSFHSGLVDKSVSTIHRLFTGLKVTGLKSSNSALWVTSQRSQDVLPIISTFYPITSPHLPSAKAYSRHYGVQRLRQQGLGTSSLWNFNFGMPKLLYYEHLGAKPFEDYPPELIVAVFNLSVFRFLKPQPNSVIKRSLYGHWDYFAVTKFHSSAGAYVAFICFGSCRIVQLARIFLKQSL